MALELVIDKLGAQGDGIARVPDGSLFVPFTLPGEWVRAEPDAGGKHATLLKVLAWSSDRAEPVCPHFGVCGGCALQHFDEHAYRTWKRARVVEALTARGLDTEVEETRSVPLGSRRRATLTLRREGKNVILGYHRARSHDLINIDVCPILSAAIAGRLPELKEALAPLLGGKREARVGVTSTESGLDVVFEDARPNARASSKLAADAGTLGLARFTAGGESLTIAPPVVTFGFASVRPPPGAFLQASSHAEAEMTTLVRDGVGKAKRVVDLFSGVGTFALALAASAPVDAYESDRKALAALETAARHTQKLKPVRAIVRDLLRTPVSARELAAYDAVVFDPPRGGAVAQAEQLARSSAKRVVAVSCNPATLARDLRLLVDGGYRLARIVPVDQFLFSGHVEVVAHLTR